jgi:hypothetical protein
MCPTDNQETAIIPAPAKVERTQEEMIEGKRNFAKDKQDIALIAPTVPNIWQFADSLREIGLPKYDAIMNALRRDTQAFLVVENALGNYLENIYPLLERADLPCNAKVERDKKKRPLLNLHNLMLPSVWIQVAYMNRDEMKPSLDTLELFAIIDV